MRKVIVTVAPVCHVGKEIPADVKNPLTPEEIAEDTINCYKAGACEVHLHTRDLQGNPTFELDVFRQTIGLIRKETDMIVQGSTGGLSTLTQWDEESVRQGFSDEEPFFYILTNTRAMTRNEAATVTRDAMEAVVKVNRDFGYRLIIISRSDSCLRGHFPLETDPPAIPVKAVNSDHHRTMSDSILR